MKCQQQPSMMLPHIIHHTAENQQQLHQHHQHQQGLHFQQQEHVHLLSQHASNDQYSQDNNCQHNLSNSGHSQQSMAASKRHYQQQTLSMEANQADSPIQYPQVVAAPPTPPSDDGVCSLYSVSPPNHPAPARGQTWIMQPPVNTSHTAYSNHDNQVPPQQTTICNYYYDIDDEFSDILSAPPSPEPIEVHAGQTLIGEQHNGHHVDNYQNYLPFNTNHLMRQQQQPHHYQHNYHHHNHHHQVRVLNHQQQQQQQDQVSQLHQNCQMGAYEASSHYVMSPDSSSLSTTSSSPSDHSLYQSSVALHPQGGQRNQPASNRGLIQQELSPVRLASEQQLSERRQQTVVGLTTNLAGHTSPVRAEQNQANGKSQIVAPNHHHHHHHRSSPIHLWEFLKELLQQVDAGCADATVIRWLDKQRGVFKIEDSVRVAKLWGKRKNKPKMNYDKLSRSIRQYYKKGIMKKTDRSQRLVYQFCSAYCH